MSRPSHSPTLHMFSQMFHHLQPLTVAGTIPSPDTFICSRISYFIRTQNHPFSQADKENFSLLVTHCHLHVIHSVFLVVRICNCHSFAYGWSVFPSFPCTPFSLLEEERRKQKDVEARSVEISIPSLHPSIPHPLCLCLQHSFSSQSRNSAQARDHSKHHLLLLSHWKYDIKEPN